MAPPAADVTLARRRFIHPAGQAQVTLRKRRRLVHLERSIVATVLAALLLASITTGAILVLTHTEEWIYVVPAALALAVIAGRLLGERVWPNAGVFFAAIVLRLYARYGRGRNARLLVTPFADFVPSRLRQTWESTAFASGLALMLGASLLFVLKGRSSALLWLSLGLLAVASSFTFLLVPHWAFGRLGLRISEPGRFVVRSVAESYDRFVRVSNGAILLVAVFYGASILADRATRMEWYFTLLSTLAAILGLGVVVTGTAAAYFKRHEERVVKRIAAEARKVGFMPVRMGRIEGGDSG
jgi:hypothetical protein